jgi:hypothetical protein
MTDPDGVIEHISSSAINFLKIDLKCKKKGEKKKKYLLKLLILR